MPFTDLDRVMQEVAEIGFALTEDNVDLTKLDVVEFIRLTLRRGFSQHIARILSASTEDLTDPANPVPTAPEVIGKLSFGEVSQVITAFLRANDLAILLRSFSEAKRIVTEAVEEAKVPEKTDGTNGSAEEKA